MEEITINLFLTSVQLDLLGAIRLWCPRGGGGEGSGSGGCMWIGGRGVKPHLDVHT